MKRLVSFASVLLLIIPLSLLMICPTNAQRDETKQGPRYSNRILIAFKEDFDSPAAARFWNRYQHLIRRLDREPHAQMPNSDEAEDTSGLISSLLNLYLARTTAPLQEVLRILSTDPDVRYVEEEGIYQSSPLPPESVLDQFSASAVARPSDPDFAKQNLESLGVMTAWGRYGTSSNTIIALLDGRIDLSNPDLAPNIHPASWNIVENSPDVSVRANVHATIIGSMAVAVHNNGYGIAGVLSRAPLLVLACLNEQVNLVYGSDAIRAIDRAIQVKSQTNQPMVMIMAWGGPEGKSQALKEAIERAGRAGILCFCAAGNTGANLDVQPEYPSVYARELPNLVPVAASAHYLENGLATYSAFGVETVPISVTATNMWGLIPGGTGLAAGTSAATGVTAGYAALLYNKYTDWLEIKNEILGSALPIEPLRGKVTAGLFDMRGILNGNQPPVVSGSDFYQVTVGQPLLATISASDPEGVQLRHFVDYGDRTPLMVSASSNTTTVLPSHQYEQPGAYVLTDYISDGISTVRKTITITVLPSLETLQVVGIKVKKGGKKISLEVTSSKQNESPRPILRVVEVNREMGFDGQANTYSITLKKPPEILTIASSAGGRTTVNW